MVLVVVAIAITALVYGSVAILVKADDFGLRMAQIGRSSATRSLGVGIVKVMPLVLVVVTSATVRQREPRLLNET